MRTDDFDYELPDELIAQAPAEPRDSCRLLVLDRKTGAVEHLIFSQIGDYLRPGDLLVANETRVMPARLLGAKEGTGGACELLLLRRREDLDALGGVWEGLVYPGKRLKPGARMEFRGADASGEPRLRAEVLDYVEGSRGGRVVHLEPAEGLSLDEALHAAGHVPLPPYITAYAGDAEKYQTVYAVAGERSAAAPTAGLHFTPELIEALRSADIGWATVELEVGIDTFRLVEEDDPADHVIHTERYHVPQATVEAVRACKERGGRVVAVGTTSVRSLESAWDEASGALLARENATTDLYLMPGSEFHVIDAMITNFHVPRSTLMMLVSSFAGRERIMAAYAEAVQERYRFFSFGDAMLII